MCLQGTGRTRQNLDNLCMSDLHYIDMSYVMIVIWFTFNKCTVWAKRGFMQTHAKSTVSYVDTGPSS